MSKVNNIFKLFPSKQLKLLLLGIIIIASIALNVFEGRSAISAAKNQNFNGGVCYVKLSAPESCGKTFGFDIYSLHITLLFLTFLVGAMYANLTFRNTLFIITIFSFAVIAITESGTRLFGLPVLYTNPMELRQSLHYSAFTLFGFYQLLVVLILSLLAGLSGFSTVKFLRKVIVLLNLKV